MENFKNWSASLCCVLGQNIFNYSRSASNQMYKCVPANLMLGGNPAMDCIPSSGESKYSWAQLVLVV